MNSSIEVPTQDDIIESVVVHAEMLKIESAISILFIFFNYYSIVFF